MTDYKLTINLPQTDFPMKADLAQLDGDGIGHVFILHGWFAGFQPLVRLRVFLYALTRRMSAPSLSSLRSMRS